MKTYNTLSRVSCVVFTILAIVLLAPSVGMAEVKIWTGNGDNANISNPDNWSGGSAPANGDAWEFGAVGSSGYTIINNYDYGTYNSGITFTQDATGTYTIAPNWTRQTGDIVNLSSFPQNVFLGHELHNDITINAANGNINIAQNNTINLNGHNLAIGGNHDTSLAILLSGTGTVTINQGAALQVSAGISDSVQSLTINQGGTLRFANHDTFGNHLSQSPVQIIADGGTVCNAPGWFTTINHLTLKNGGDLIDNTGHDGWLSFQLVNEFNVTADSTLAPNQISTIAIGTEGAYNGVIPYGVNFNVADVTGDASTDLLVSARLRDGGRRNEGGGNFTKSGAGTMELTGVNEITGNITISQGILKVSGNGTLGSGQIILNNGALEYAYDTEQTVSNVITGTGEVIKSGSGVLKMTTNFSYTGTTTVKEGTLELTQPGQTGTLAAGSTVTVDGATAVLAGHGDILGYSSTSVGTVNLQNGGTFYNDSTDAHVTVGAAVNMNNGVITADPTAQGSGEFGNFVFDNAINVTGGTDNAISANRITLRQYTGTSAEEVGGKITVADGAKLTISSQIMAHNSAKVVPLVKLGAGELVLSGDSTFTTGTFVYDGTLRLTKTGTKGTLAKGSEVTVDGSAEGSAPVLAGHGDILGFAGSTVGTVKLINGGRFHNDGAAEQAAHVTVGAVIEMNNGLITAEDDAPGSADYGNFVFDNAINVTGGTDNAITANEIVLRQYNGTPGGNGGKITVAQNAKLTITSKIGDTSNYYPVPLTKLGEGTLVLSGDNVYLTGTTVSEGTLQLTGDAIKANSAIEIAQNAILEYYVPSGKKLLDFTTSDKTVSGNGTIAKTGEGTLLINAAQDAVDVESLIVSSGRLDMKEYFTGALEVADGATFSPGNSIGKLEQTGNFILDSGAKLLMEIGGADAELNDQLIVNGDFSIANDAIIEIILAGNSNFTSGDDFTAQIIANTLNGGNPADGDVTSLFEDYLAPGWPFYDLSVTKEGNVYSIHGTYDPNAVPEPSTWALLVLSVVTLFLRKRVRS